MRGGDLRLRLVDAGERALDARVLQRALTAVVLERRLRRVDRGGGLRDLRAKIVVRQQHQLVSLPNALVVVHLHFTNESDNLRAQRCEIPPDVGIVGHLLDASALPGIPVPRDRERDRDGHQHDEHRCAESSPGGLQRIDRVFNLRVRGRDDGGCGHFESSVKALFRSGLRTASRCIDACPIGLRYRLLVLTEEASRSALI